MATIASAQSGQQASAATDFSALNRDVLALFNERPIVAVGEGNHNSALTFEWLTSLIHEETFPEVVRNIVVEFGTSAYQQVMDDFTDGKNVPDSLLRMCWRETTQILVWDSPIYADFFRTVRARNLTLPAGRKIRVLLGDPDWHHREESRDAHVLGIIEREVLARRQTAMLIYGDMHLVYRDEYFNYPEAHEVDSLERNIVQHLMRLHPGKTYALWGSVNTGDSLIRATLVKERIQSPCLIMKNGSGLWDIDFMSWFPYGGYRVDADGEPLAQADYRAMPIREIVDGILYRGDWTAQQYIAPRPDDLYADTVYLNELIRRAEEMQFVPYIRRLQYYKWIGSPGYSAFTSLLKEGDADVVDRAFQAQRQRFPAFDWMNLLNMAGYVYLRRSDMDMAIALFELAVRQFPMESNVYDSLGDAYLAIGDRDKAIASYRRAVELDPENAGSRRKLEEAGELKN